MLPLRCCLCSMYRHKIRALFMLSAISGERLFGSYLHQGKQNSWGNDIKFARRIWNRQITRELGDTNCQWTRRISTKLHPMRWILLLFSKGFKNPSNCISALQDCPQGPGQRMRWKKKLDKKMKMLITCEASSFPTWVVSKACSMLSLSIGTRSPLQCLFEKPRPSRSSFSTPEGERREVLGGRFLDAGER